MVEFENVAIVFNKILGLRQCPQYTLNNVLLNFIKHMKKWGGGTIRYSSPPIQKLGGRVPHPPRIDALVLLITNLKQSVIKAVKLIQQVGVDLNFKGSTFLHLVRSSLVSTASQRQLKDL